MYIFISIRRLVKTFWLLVAAVALYIFYQSIGLNMFFLLVVGLLALKFVPVLVLPIILIAIGVHFSGGFSFIADAIVLGFWGLICLPICVGFMDSVRQTLEQRKKDKR